MSMDDVNDTCIHPIDPERVLEARTRGWAPRR